MASFAEKTYRTARKQVLDKGAPVVFRSYTAPQPTIPHDETVAPEAEEVLESLAEGLKGWAVELPGSAEEYSALGLTEADAVTLFFVPDLIGYIPDLSSTAAWAGRTRTVQQIFAVRPDGTAVAARLILT